MKEHDPSEHLFNNKILEDIGREFIDRDPVRRRCKFVSFISRSAGIGRRRRPREVNLLVVDKKYSFQVIDGVPRRIKSNFIAIDVAALEILDDIPWESRSVELLIQRAIENAK